MNKSKIFNKYSNQNSKIKQVYNCQKAFKKAKIQSDHQITKKFNKLNVEFKRRLNEYNSFPKI